MGNKTRVCRYVANDFDIMTEQLQSVTVSRGELGKEIEIRKQTEASLRESEERYRSLFENMLDGFAYCKMLYDEENRPVDFVYLDVNQAFARLTGLENVIGKKVTEAIPGMMIKIINFLTGHF